MHWSAFIVFALINGVVLWLGAKFFGKKGLAYVALLEIILSLMLISSSVFIFSVPVSGILIYLMTILFVIFLFYKKYAFKDILKLLFTIGVAILFVGLNQAIYFAYIANLASAWNFALIPMLAILVSISAGVAVGFLVDKYAKFIKDFSLRNFVSLACAILSLILVFNLFTLTGVVSFGNFLLSVLISLLVSVAFMLALLLMEKLGWLIKKPELENKLAKLQKNLKKEITIEEIEEE